MRQPSLQPIEVRFQSDVAAARRAAKTVAQELGFAPHATEEIALAITELGTNLIKHAGSGTLFVSSLTLRPRVGLEIESLDNGPGIPDVEQALTDRFSTTGSRGTGLGAVHRLMDEMDIASSPGRGTRIVCRKWLRVVEPATRPCPLAFGVATRASPGFRENGDAFVIRQWNESALVGVIDGLGHGQFAQQAALTARHYIETHYDAPLDSLFGGVSRACRATRGVVMALARFDWGRESMMFASVGDIEARAFPRSGRPSFPVQRGILGLKTPSLVVSEQHWDPANILVLHSDGLHTHWTLKDFPGIAALPASKMAAGLLNSLTRGHDDATVLVVRKALP